MLMKAGVIKYEWILECLTGTFVSPLAQENEDGWNNSSNERRSDRD